MEMDILPGYYGWSYQPAFKNTIQVTRLSFYFRTIVRTYFLHTREEYQALPPEIVEIICEYADDYVYEPLPCNRGAVHHSVRHMIPRNIEEAPTCELYSAIDYMFQI